MMLRSGKKKPLAAKVEAIRNKAAEATESTATAATDEAAEALSALSISTRQNIASGSKAKKKLFKDEGETSTVICVDSVKSKANSSQLDRSSKSLDSDVGDQENTDVPEELKEKALQWFISSSNDTKTDDSPIAPATAMPAPSPVRRPTQKYRRRPPQSPREKERASRRRKHARMARNTSVGVDAGNASKRNTAPLIIISPPKYSASSKSQSNGAPEIESTSSPTPQQKMFKSIASAIAVASSLREGSCTGNNSESFDDSSDKKCSRSEKLKKWKLNKGRRAGIGGGIGQSDSRKSGKPSLFVNRKPTTKGKETEEALLVDGCVAEKKKGGMFTMFFSPGNGNPCGFANQESTKFSPKTPNLALSKGEMVAKKSGSTKDTNSKKSDKEFTILELRTKELESELRKSQNEVEVLKADIANLRSDLEEKVISETKAHQKFLEQKQELENVESTLQSKNEELELRSCENDELCIKLEAMEVDLKEAIAKSEAIATEVESLREEMSSVKSSAQKNQERAEVAESKLKSVKREMKNTNASVAKVVAAAEENARKAKENHADTVQRLEDQIIETKEQHEQDITQLTQQKDALEKKLLETKTAVKTKIEEVSSKLNEKEKLAKETEAVLKKRLSQQEKTISSLELNSDRLEIECEMKDKKISKLQSSIADATAEAERVVVRHKEDKAKLLSQFEAELEGKTAEIKRLHEAAMNEKTQELASMLDARRKENEKFQLSGQRINELVKDVEAARDDARSARLSAERDAAALAEEVQRRRHLEESSKSETESLRAKISQLEDKLTDLESLKDNEVAASVAETDKLRSENQALIDAASAQHTQTLSFQDMLKKCMEKCKAHEADADEKSKMIDRLLKQVTELKAADIEKEKKVEIYRAKVMEAEKTRRKLHNTVMDLRGNIRVGCRIRPHLGEAGGNAEGNYSFPDALVEQRSVQLTMAPRKSLSGEKGKGRGKTHSFQFDRVFGPSATQADVYEEISQMVQSAVDGYNVCIFAYGQTGSGKTHTMLGAETGTDSSSNAPMYDLEGENAGMMPRAAKHVFSYMAEMHDQGWKFDAEATMVEIYCETIRDLLNVPQGAKEGPVCELRKVRTRDEKTGGIKLHTKVDGITSTPVGSAEDILRILHKAVKTRATAETKCNARSSRSHTVFTLKIRGFDTKEKFVNGQTKPTIREGQLHLIDLAGSERLDRSGSADNKKLLREAQSINKSLSCLGNVIGAIANKAAHVPFRDSKLTQLLENSLAGDSKALMFCNLSPVENALNESLCSLWFAEKVNKCERK